MKLYIKSMVCSRCKMVVKDVLEHQGLHALSVNLGEVEITEELTKAAYSQLNNMLLGYGFELIDDKRSQTIEKIKNIIINEVHHSNGASKVNLSELISANIQQDYNYLSNLFSESEGFTIEKFYITQKIEKVKELLVYGELTLSQIADELGYSSVAYLSNQFKKITGLTPSYFKSIKGNKRTNLEDL